MNRISPKTVGRSSLFPTRQDDFPFAAKYLTPGFAPIRTQPGLSDIFETKRSTARSSGQRLC